MQVIGGDRIRFCLKKPGNGRARFAVMLDVVKRDGRRTSKLVKDERIDSVNHVLEQKLRHKAQCEIEIKEIIKTLYAEEEKKRGRIVFNEENREILSAYWKVHYESSDNVDLKSAHNELVRAIEAIGAHSLVSAGKKDLEDALRLKAKGNKQRRLASTINQLLKHLGRSFTVKLDKKERRPIRYLNPSEFDKVLEHLAEPIYQDFFSACFSTGGRTGEIFAFEEHHQKKDVIFIETQLDREEVNRETKNRRQRHTVIMPGREKRVRSWIERSDVEKRAIRNETHARIFRDACKKAFPQNPKKWCNVKDLRHSYAVWLLNQGVNIGLVAQSLGNSEQVCQEYYAGFVLSPDSVQAIKSILKGGKAR